MRIFALVYGLAGYAAFNATLLYLMGFTSNWGVPKSIDSGPEAVGLAAVLINIGLIALFGLQHTIMARPRFKAWLTRVVPQPLERSTFIFASAGAFALLFACWQPLPTVIWQADHRVLAEVLLGVSLAGYGLILYSTFLVSHWDLAGLRQVWLYVRGRPYTPVQFRERSLYKYVRHPMMIGVLLAVWFTPVLTVGHLLFAAVFTAYVLVGLHFEERDLEREHGAAYEAYRDRVPMLVPRLHRRPVATVPREA